MKAKTFENLLRKVVREEIDYALRREIKSLKEDLRDEITPRIIESNQNSIKESKTPNSSLKETIMGKNPIRKKQNQKPKKFVSNGTLNDLLNETAQGDTNLSGGSSSPVSLSEPFASGDPMPMETAGLPPSVADAMTRDYSGLMEAIDKKKGK
tara:strand:- start:1729 stop:2187 length:459 start_codon:yes stop_codon:yes gene_type:complete